MLTDDSFAEVLNANLEVPAAGGAFLNVVSGACHGLFNLLLGSVPYLQFHRAKSNLSPAERGFNAIRAKMRAREDSSPTGTPCSKSKR
jgi:hypothetical protein